MACVLEEEDAFAATPAKPQADETERVDVVIIGAGLSGLWCATKLARSARRRRPARSATASAAAC